MATNTIRTCTICLQTDSEFVTANETDYNNIKWICKLTYCIPEVIWKEDCLLCESCKKLLNASCSFRNLCLKSNHLHNLYICTTKDKKVQNCDCYICDDSEKTQSFVCHLCGQSFTTKLSLVQHIPTHSCCSFCNEQFTTAIQLQQHIMQVHGNKNITKHPEIEENGTKYATGRKPEGCNGSIPECLDDMKAKSPKLDDNDDKVMKESKTKSNPLKTLRKRSRRTTFSCEECKTVFVSSTKLVNHMIRSHESDSSLIKPFQCDKCDGKFSTSSNLMRHKKYHVGNRTNICTFCGKGYITKSDLNNHEKQHLNKREYQCVECPKTFNTNKDLRSHRLVVHTEPTLWNYVCTFCEKRFPIKSNLDQHLRRHTGDKRFGCHICEKRFVDKIVLQKHIKSHSNFRAYKCELCNKEYKDCKVLEVHLTKVHGIGNAKIPVRVKKYFCHVCPKSYFAKNKLTRHMFSHTGEKPYVCHVCERKFTDKSYVKQHLKTAHNVIELQEEK